ncbi:MAG: plasmid mobilization protein [Nocardioidaceae bacterium]
MSSDVNEMTESHLADHYYAQRDDPATTGEQVDFRPPRGARVGVRLSFEEERCIREAADMAGMTVSAYLRQAGLSAAATRVVDIDRLRRNIDEARARIDDAWRALA